MPFHEYFQSSTLNHSANLFQCAEFRSHDHGLHSIASSFGEFFFIFKHLEHLPKRKYQFILATPPFMSMFMYVYVKLTRAF